MPDVSFAELADARGRAPVAQLLPYLAQIAGAKPPLHVPSWLSREPRYPSWREAFRARARG